MFVQSSHEKLTHTHSCSCFQALRRICGLLANHRFLEEFEPGGNSYQVLRFGDRKALVHGSYWKNYGGVLGGISKARSKCSVMHLATTTEGLFCVLTLVLIDTMFGFSAFLSLLLKLVVSTMFGTKFIRHLKDMERTKLFFFHCNKGHLFEMRK